MSIFLTVLHVMVCAVLVVVVLLQHGKGADIGAVFGGGASNTVFGSRGAGNFLTRLTTGSAIVFMVTSLALSYLANTRSTRSIFEDEPAPATAPAETTPAAETGGFEEVTPPPAEGGGFEEVAPPAASTPEEPATTQPPRATLETPALQEPAATPEASAEPSAAPATEEPKPAEGTSTP